MDRREEIGIPWLTTLAFIRISTNPAAYSRVGSIADVMSVMEELLDQSNVQTISPGAAHWRILSKLIRDAQVTRNLVSDAHLAALAIEHNAALCTNDRDFTRFPGLKIVNPIAKQ